MDNNLENVINKVSEILKEKNIDLNTKSNNKISTDDTCEEDFFDIKTILKIKEIYTKFNDKSHCNRNTLLRALKPYLINKKKDKLEQYINIATLICVLEESDINLPINLNQNKKGYDYLLIITLLLLII